MANTMANAARIKAAAIVAIELCTMDTSIQAYKDTRTGTYLWDHYPWVRRGISRASERIPGLICTSWLSWEA